MQGYRRGLLPKPSPRFHPRVNEQRNSLREETIRHAVRLDPIFDAYIHPSPSFPHGRYACAVRKPVRARCFGEFCYVFVLFSHTSKLFGTNPSNVLFCFYFSFIPLADFASRPRFHSIPFDSIVLRCLSHKQFPLIRGTQPSGTIRREQSNQVVQSNGPTNQQPTNRLLRHDSVETFGTTRTHMHRPTTLTLISIATPSGTIRREPDAILGGQSLPIHSFIQTSFLVGTMVRFCLSVCAHIHTHTNNPQYRASPVPFFSALCPLLPSPPPSTTRWHFRSVTQPIMFDGERCVARCQPVS
mmetsp:Transcript_12927/g.36428  ORF Transcript_12927/g.36428 Transcript_12927/m.36428 type:complete len:299 (+) Transcript_12927:86-982(+)